MTETELTEALVRYRPNMLRIAANVVFDRHRLCAVLEVAT